MLRVDKHLPGRRSVDMACALYSSNFSMQGVKFLPSAENRSYRCHLHALQYLLFEIPFYFLSLFVCGGLAVQVQQSSKIEFWRLQKFYFPNMNLHSVNTGINYR